MNNKPDHDQLYQIAEEFIRCFLQHVLPKGFVKVRYYDFFSSGKRHHLTSLHQHLLNHLPCSGSDHQDLQTSDQAVEPSLKDQIQCPTCGRVIQLHQILRPNRRAPS